MTTSQPLDRPAGPASHLAVPRRRVLTAGLVAAGTVMVPRLDGLAVDAPVRAGLDAEIRRLMRLGKLPGVSAAVLVGRDVVWARGFGFGHLGRRDPVRPSTIFMLASISKTFVATAVMQAVEQGLFGLDDDVHDVLSFPVRTPEHPRRAITARHLLTHTSAIRDRWSVWDDLYADGDSTIALGDFLEDYLVPGRPEYRRTNFYDTVPGARYRYSNVGAALAAYLVEAASGQGFDDWCADRIFGPLGMDRAGWHLADVPAADVAMPYRWSPAEDRFVAIGQYGYPDYPDGALRTTAPQLARHFGMTMHAGRWEGVRVLERASVREMLRWQVPHTVPGQGLIWYRVRGRHRTLIGHTGGDKGVATTAFFDPHRDVAVIVLSNGNWRRAEGRWPLSQIMHRLFDEFA
jgi:CubicO group peptidase (beta-lactamase class C family)